MLMPFQIPPNRRHDLLWRCIPRCGLCRVKTGGHLLLEGLILGGAQQTLGDELFGVDLTHGWMGRYLPIHDRLSERRLIGFVMAMPAIAPEIDHHIGMELLAKSNCQPRDMDDCLRVITIHMEDRRLNALGNISGIGGKAALLGHRGEADLVVHDHMDGAAGAPVWHFGQSEGFLHDALAAEGSIAVDEDRNDTGALVVVQVDLFGTNDPFDDRINQFKMAGVEAQGKVDPLAGAGDPLTGEPQVVLHIAGAAVFLMGKDAGKFGEHQFQRLADDMSKHIEPAAVGHADDGFLGAGDGGRRRRSSSIAESGPQRLRTRIVSGRQNECARNSSKP